MADKIVSGDGFKLSACKLQTLSLLMIAGFALLLFQCAPHQFPDSHFAACYPNHPYDTVSFPWCDPADSVLRFLSKSYSNYSLSVANAAGLLPLVTAYEKEKMKMRNDSGARQEIKILDKRQRIMSRISLFRAQVAGVAAELDCEGERADQLSAFMDKSDRRRTKNLTVASIVTGAVAGIMAATLKSNDAQTVAIVGGTGSALLGLLSLSSNKKINFKHPRNLLKDIWELPVHSRHYPTMVWNMLSHTRFSNSGEFSVAYYTRTTWKSYWQLNPSDKHAAKTVNLLMGEGGLYAADDLKLRANMINQLQAAVKLIDEDIQGLLSEIDQEKK